MGFLGRIFGPPEHKQYSLEEAIRLIENGLEKLQSKNQEESYLTATHVHNEMKQLAALIREFAKKETPELAKSSANVKERFCSLAERQLKNMTEPLRSSSANYLSSCQSVLDSLGGLTQRQMLHISFFFKEDFKPVARKIKEIGALLAVPKGAGDQAKAVNMYHRIGELEKRRAEIFASISHDEQLLKQLEAQHHDLPALTEQPDSYDLDKAETKLKSIKQDIDSFLAVQKLLKKYAYAAGVKDQLLDNYIESPNAALLKDDDMKIIEYIRSAASMAGEGKIEADRPEKLDQILSGGDYIRNKRSELIAAANSVEEERKRLRHTQERFETSLKARTNRLAEIEGEIKTLEKAISARKEEAVSISKELTTTRTELLLLASRLLNANVN